MITFITSRLFRTPRGWTLVGLALLAWGLVIGLAHQMAVGVAFLTSLVGG